MLHPIIPHCSPLSHLQSLTALNPSLPWACVPMRGKDGLSLYAHLELHAVAPLPPHPLLRYYCVAMLNPTQHPGPPISRSTHVDTVDYGQKALCCDTCDVWFHHTCVDMSSRTYSSLTRSSKDWFCYRCNSINSSIYHEYEYTVPTRNSFSLLNLNLSTPLDDDVFTSPQAPRAHSSPVGTSIPRSAASIHSGTRSTESSDQVHHNSEPSRQHSSPVSASTGVNWRTILLNANSIFGKSAELHHLLDYMKADAVLINKSKLDSEISTPEVIPDNLGYTVYRKDRNRHGGGVMILIKNCYSSQIVDIKSDAELLWIEVQLKNQRKLLLSTFYRPPSSDDEYLKLFDASLLDIRTRTANNPNHTIIVGGDFNLPDINWEHNCVSASSSKKKLHDSFLSTLADHNLSQMVTEPTREDHILDLMLTNNPSIIKSVHILPGVSDHEFVLSDSNLAPSYTRKLPRKIHLFSKANWAEVRQKISDFRATYFNTMSELDINIQKIQTSFIP